MLIATDQLGHTYSIVVNEADGSLLVNPVFNASPSQVDNSVSISVMALIASALRLINVIASGETVPAAEAADSLMALQHMLDSWNAERTALYTTRADDYALVIGKQNYTLGSGGDFNTNRPARIESMSTILLTNPANPIEVPISMYTVDQWQTQVPVKNVPGSFPLVCYDDGNFPLRTLSMWPIPTQVNNVRIYSWQPLGVPPTLQSTIAFPPGYAEAFRFNLAVRLAAEFATPVPASVQAIAVESLARLKSLNVPDLLLRSDLVPDSGGWNYRADEFGLPY